MDQTLNPRHPKHGNSVLSSLLFGLLSVFVVVPSLEAAIIPTGNVEPAGTWTSSTTGYVGRTSDGSLLVDAGSVLQSKYAYIAGNSGVAGTVTVAGSSSKWTNSNNLFVGNYGTGTLCIEAGGQVTDTYGYLGYYSGSTGTATVVGSASKWTNSGDLCAGYRGTGTLRIAAGGQVSSIGGYLGYESGAAGTVTVAGAGSQWTNSVGLYVGRMGTGTLRIEAGGQVTSSHAYLGNGSGSSGAATVTGAGSKWTNNGYLYIGSGGTGTLTVTDGGEVTTQTLYASLGSLLGNGTITATKGAVLDANLRFDAAHSTQVTCAFGSGGTLTVSAAGGIFGAGYKGNGSLTVAEGVAITSSDGYLGYWAGSSGTATVTAAGSKWTNSSSLYVGYKGTGTLRIEAAGQVSDSSGHLGYESGSSGTATVTGAGSKWTNSGALNVGYKGVGTLRIEAGGQVSNSLGYLGYESGSSGTATVTGAGSLWTSSSNLAVGSKGVGTLRIEAGGQVSDSNGYIGAGSGSTGMATVTGAGSKWTNSGSLYVGYDGAGTLTVADGGEVTAKTLYASLGSLLGNSTIIAQGAVLDADLRFDAAHGTQATNSFGSGGTVTVNAAGGNLGAGYKSNGSLTVAEGVAINSSFGYLGYNSGSSGTATVTGAGSKWTNSAYLYVGNFGAGTLRIEAGGQVSNQEGYLGYESGSWGMATVTGAGSKWINSYSSLYIGDSGTGTLCIEAGGQVSDSSGYLGYNSGSTGAVTVTGAGSQWTNSGDLYVGYYGTGTLRIEGGGQVSNVLGGYLGYGSGSSSTATVTGAGSKWTNSGSLSVGSFGNGTLHIRDGGMVTASSVFAGNSSLLTFDVGSGSNLYVGGGTGTITNNGKIRVLAGPQLAAGSQYSPITAGTWTGSGTYQALGGTWNATSHVFTVSQTLAGVSGTPVAVDLAQRQRVLVNENARNWNVGVSFLSKTGTGNTFNFTATAVAGTDLTALNGLIEPGQSVLSGWNFTAAGTGYSASDPVYLSLGIPANLTHDDLQLWRLSGSAWSRITIDDLTATGGYASFTSTGLSNYAVTAALPSSAWKTNADGLWQNGSNWSTNPNAPGGINTAALLGPSITAPRTVTLSVPLTLGVLTFDSTQHYTLAGTDELKLQVNPSYTAEIDVENSDAHGHVIETPITLASPLKITLAPSSSLTLSGEIQNTTGQTLTLSGGGTLTVTQGLATTGAINVQAGTLITPSLTADTLTIGSTSPLAAVPEPSSLLILLAAAVCIAIRFLLARRRP